MLATALFKAGAVQFLSKLKSKGFTSVRHDLIEALKSATRLTSPRKAIIYVGDGFVGRDLNAMRRIVNEITSRNTMRARIHTVGVSPHPGAEEFLKNLAARNGGTYKRVE